jgi:hypothetical protein
MTVRQSGYRQLLRNAGMGRFGVPVFSMAIKIKTKMTGKISRPGWKMPIKKFFRATDSGLVKMAQYTVGSAKRGIGKRRTPKRILIFNNAGKTLGNYDLKSRRPKARKFPLHWNTGSFLVKQLSYEKSWVPFQYNVGVRSGWRPARLLHQNKSEIRSYWEAWKVPPKRVRRTRGPLKGQWRYITRAKTQKIKIYAKTGVHPTGGGWKKERVRMPRSVKNFMYTAVRMSKNRVAREFASEFRRDLRRI